MLNQEIRDLIEHNVRFARQWWGDVQSQIASNITAERRVQALIRKNGLDVVLKSFEAAIDYSRARFLKAMEAMPNTSVTAGDIYMEDNGFGEGPFRVQVTITKTPDRIVVDFAGTDPQSLSTVNCSEGVARAATYIPLIAVLDPDVPLNQGVIDLIEFRAPRGCLVNPVYPAPCFASTADPGDRISEIMQTGAKQAAARAGHRRLLRHRQQPDRRWLRPGASRGFRLVHFRVRGVRRACHEGRQLRGVAPDGELQERVDGGVGAALSRALPVL